MSRVEVINSRGCSKVFGELTSSSFPSFRGLKTSSLEPPSMSPLSSSSSLISQSKGPFSGLVICVTGLSKEARKQVMDATERLGGRYSPHLHPQCTHLVVQISRGRKFEHALKHGFKNGLFVVRLGWFVDSVRRNVRLSESIYGVKSAGENGTPMNDLNRVVHHDGAENSCLPVRMIEAPNPSEKEVKRSFGSTLFGHTLYVDINVSAELQRKVVEAATGEGATLVDQWFVGHNASHVVCEGPSVHKYLGHSNNLVTPLWVLKTAKEKRVQRLVHISADLARRVGTMLDNVENGICGEDNNKNHGSRDAPSCRLEASHEERQKIVNQAKDGVRKRRCRRMQSCQTPIRPITPSSLLDSICWSISEPSSNASVYTDSSSIGDASEHHSSFFDAKGDEKESVSSFLNFSRPLTESDKNELILKNHFLTILFPVDRFGEMGPCSRTFFSDTGFTCLRVLDHIYAFYQENMSSQEIEVALHTDSRHADRLRSVYSSKEMIEFKRVDFLGSRKSFEMLKRVTGDNNSNVYELLIRA
ncbi:hypothetical protein LguiB_009583 [Lonicera macranthoides]